MKIESRFGGKDIEPWQLARELTRQVYYLTKKSRRHGTAVSSINHISEGFDSETNVEFIRFLRYASAL